MDIKDKSLFIEKCFINNDWVDSDSKEKFDVFNPLDGSKIGSVPKCGRDETKRAIDAANEAFLLWRDYSAKQRAQILEKWFFLIEENKDDLAKIMTIEQGKVFSESLGEVSYASSFIKWFSEEARRIYGDVIASEKPNQRYVVIKQPIGVVAAITPWNFPAAMITRKCAPALAAGCTVVLKPAEDTPFTAFALAKLAQDAGFPKGVINIVTGVPKDIGLELSTHPKVKKLSFTGSTPVGKLLMQQCSQSVKKVSLELGGNAPFIVFDDADLKKALAGVMASKFRNSGQTCVCANRVFVQEGIYDSFTKELKDAVAQLKVGDGLKKDVSIGPLINKKAIDKVTSLVEGAKKEGAEVLLGAGIHKDYASCYLPTILSHVKGHMEIFHEEIFGPVVSLVKFKTEKEAVELANSTQYGLASYFYSQDIGRIWRVSESLEYGMVGVNEGMTSNTASPFGGVKESGFGREGSKYGIDDYVIVKSICMTN